MSWGVRIMLSLQEISDRLEIQQLMVDYATAIDTKTFDALDLVFTPDAYIDYRAMGGIDGRFPEVKAWLAQVLPNFSSYYHMIGNVSIKVSGDTATSKIICFNPMQMDLADGSKQTMFLGLWYIDKFVRTAAGWRMSERVEESCYAANVPSGMSAG
jgi:SnoaL-like protein